MEAVPEGEESGNTESVSQGGASALQRGFADIKLESGIEEDIPEFQQEGVNGNTRCPESGPASDDGQSVVEAADETEDVVDDGVEADRQLEMVPEAGSSRRTSRSKTLMEVKAEPGTVSAVSSAAKGSAARGGGAGPAACKALRRVSAAAATQAESGTSGVLEEGVQETSVLLNAGARRTSRRISKAAPAVKLEPVSESEGGKVTAAAEFADQNEDSGNLPRRQSSASGVAAKQPR